MYKKFQQQESRGLPGGPNEMFSYVTGVFSMDGYKNDSPDVNNPYNIIPSGNITMKGVDFPVHGTDNYGNQKMMYPGNDYKFPGDQVFEVPMARSGGALLNKTMKCNNCGWSWKAADGGADVNTCHKCGGEALIKAQAGKDLTRNGRLQYDKPDPNATYKLPSYEEYSNLVNKEKTKKVETIADRQKLEKQISNYNIRGEITTDGSGQKFQKQQKLAKDKQGNLVINEYLIKVDDKPLAFNDSGNSPINRALAYPYVYASERTGTTDFFKGDPAYDAASKQGLGASMMDGLSLMSPYAWDYSLGKVGTNNQSAYSIGDEFITDIALSGPASLAGNLVKKGIKPVAKEIPLLMNKGRGMLDNTAEQAKAAIQNTYKYNPWAFKPNPESYYRMGKGRKFIDDVLETNKIRAYNENSYANLRADGKISGIREDGEILLKAKTFPEPDTYWSKGVPLDGRYAPQKYGDYMIEASNDIPFINSVNQRTKQKGFWDAPDVNYNATHNTGNYVKPRQSYGYNIEGNIKTSIGTPLEYNSDLIKLYEPHWLKGYKEIPNKQPTTSVDDVGKSFNSEVYKNGFDISGITSMIPHFNPLAVVDGVGPMKLSPLNMLPFYGKKLPGGQNKAFRKFGNNISDVESRHVLSPSGSNNLRMGSKRVNKEGNWAEYGKVNEGYPGTFEATFDFNALNTNLSFINPPNRNGVLIKDINKQPLTEIPISDPAVSFNRRLPFSERYVPIDKQKLLNNEFQLSTIGGEAQSLIEKYGTWVGGSFLVGMDSEFIDLSVKQPMDKIEKFFKDLDAKDNKASKYRSEQDKRPRLMSAPFEQKQYGGEETKEFQKGGEYKVKTGDTFYGIASKNKITKEALLKANPGLDIQNLKLNQLIKLPTPPPAPKPAPKPVAEPVKPKPQETAWSDYINPMNWGVTDRDDDGSFRQAFRAARVDGDDEFMWYGKRYTTDLVEKEIKKETTNVPLKPSSFLPTYFNDIKQIENAEKKGWDSEKQKWFPYESFEDPKSFDIGYGHKIKTGEDYSKGLTEKEILALIKKDFNEHEKLAAHYINKTHGANTWANLNSYQKTLLTDTQYNVGSLGEFPSFSKGVVNNDKETMLKEYKRYTDGKPLGRNKWILETINDYIESDQFQPIKKQAGGETEMLSMYSDYMMGKYDGTDTEEVGKKIYDKMNRLYYKQAKQAGVTVPNYIMTNIIRQTA